MLIYSWLQEIHDKVDNKAHSSITEEEVIRLMTWIEQEVYSEEDAFVLFWLLRGRHGYSTNWESYYKRFTQKFDNPVILARFHRFASATYTEIGRPLNAADAATQAFLLDGSNYENLWNYFLSVNDLSVETKLELIEQSLVLEPYKLQARHNAIGWLIRLSRRCENQLLSQKLRTRTLELCDETIDLFPNSNHLHIKQILKVKHRILDGSAL